MLSRYCIIILIKLLIFSELSNAQTGYKTHYSVAILDFYSDNMKDDQVEYFSQKFREYLQWLLINENDLPITILDGPLMHEILIENNMALNSSLRSSELIYIGKLLEIDGVIYGEFDGSTIEVQLIDVNSEKQIKRKSFNNKIDIGRSVDFRVFYQKEIIPSITKYLFPEAPIPEIENEVIKYNTIIDRDTIRDTIFVLPEPPPPLKDWDAIKKCLLPGSGQKYAGYNTQGEILAYSQYALMSSTVVLYFSAKSASNKAENAYNLYRNRSSGSQDVYNTLFADWQNKYNSANSFNRYYKYIRNITFLLFAYNIWDGYKKVSNLKSNRINARFYFMPYIENRTTGINISMRFK